MTENELDFLPLRATWVRSNGKRQYDPQDKRRLIEACLCPGVSVAGMALKAGVNTNQLRKWIRMYREERHNTTPRDGSLTFVPAIEIDTTDVQGALVTAGAPSVFAQALPAGRQPERLIAVLPNGISVEFACAVHDGERMRTLVELLGSCHVSA
jgi:transposase